MENRGRVLSVDFSDAFGRTVKASPLTAIDYGQILEIHGLPLPPSFECHFSKNGATAYKSIGTTTNGVGTVPFIDAQTQSGGIITAYIYLHETADDGETEYRIIIPVESRPGVTPAEPTPVEQDVIAQAISALNNAVTTTTENVAITEANKNASAQSAEEAEANANRADTAWNGAVIAQNSAQASADTASQKATEASQSASTAHSEAQYAKSYSESAHTDAQSAEQSATSAQNSATSASNSATLAQQYASTATAKASEAMQSASVATSSAQDAQRYADISQTNAEDAESAKSIAVDAQTGAVTAKGLAEEAQASAQESAESAQASADRAEQEADRWYEFLPVDTATGSIAHFTDGAKDVPVKALSVSLEPIQDLNGQDSPYPAGGGKNLFDKDAVTVSSWLSTTTGQVENASSAYVVSDFIPVKQGQTVFIPVTNTVRRWFYDAQKNPKTFLNNSNGQIFAPTEDGYIRVTIKTDVVSIDTFQIEFGSTATAYAPYSNICPITGHTQVVVNRTGKNLLPNNLENQTKAGVTFVRNDDGTVTMNGTGTTDNVSVVLVSRKADWLANGTYTLTGGDALPGGQIRVNTYDSDGNIIKRHNYTNTPVTVTITDDVAEIGASIFIGNGTVYNNTVVKPMLRLSSDADDTYEPYTAQSITIPLGDTVYGGTLDVVNGVLTVDRAMVDMGTLNWVYNQTQGYFDGSLSGVTDVIKRPASGDALPNVLSSVYLEDTANHVWNRVNDGRIAVRTTNGHVWVRDTTKGTDAAAFKTAMDGVQLVYPLATPITVLLTTNQMTTLLGINNIWSDSGDVSVDYRADIQLYIQKMIANALNA